MNKRGFSLIELLVAVAIFGVLSVSMGSMFTNQLVAANFIEDKMSRNSFKMDLQNLVNDSTACTQSVLGVAVPKVGAAPVPVVLKDMNGNVLYDSTNAQKNTYDKLNISSITLSNVNVPGPNSQGTVQLSVVTQRQRAGGGPQNFPALTYNIQTVVDNAGLATSCGVNSSGACLDYAASLSSLNGGTMTVPANAKAMEIRFPSGSASSNGTGSKGGGNVGACSYSGGSPLVIYFGVTKINGYTLQAGKVLQYVSSGASGSWIYDSRTLASGTMGCTINGPTAPPWTTFVPGGSLGATCPSTMIPAPQSTGGGSGGNVSMGNKSIIKSAGIAIIWR